ncbi:hypothetical protein [Neobacillus niacini]
MAHFWFEDYQTGRELVRLNLSIKLKEKVIKVVVVNPAHVKQTKELDDNSSTKNDVKDRLT